MKAEEKKMVDLSQLKSQVFDNNDIIDSESERLRIIKKIENAKKRFKTQEKALIKTGENIENLKKELASIGER